MSKYARIGASKLPTMLGMGILGASIGGVIAALCGMGYPLSVELAAVAAGMFVGLRYS